MSGGPSRSVRHLLLGGIVALASGCFFKDLDFAGRACDPNDACPEGLSCIATTHTCERGVDLGVGDLDDRDLSPGVGDLEHQDLSERPCVDPPDAGASYVIYRLPTGAVINLASPVCDEPFWSSVPPVSFTGVNQSDNVPTCRVVWSPGQPDVIYGCCDVTDKDLRGHIMANDGVVYLDDGFEYLLKGDLTAVFDATTSKIQLNVLGFYADGNYPTGIHDSLYDAHVVTRVKLTGTLNDTTPDTKYSIKWRADVGFRVTAPQVGYCDFQINDLDLDGGVEVRTTSTAFGNVTNTNDPTQWRSCLLSCTSP